VSTTRPSGDKSGSIAVFDHDWQEMLDDAPDGAFGPQEELFGEVKNEALARIFPPGPGTMLECGCGTAEVSAYFAQRGYACTLLDASDTALELARRRFAAVGQEPTLVNGDVYDMPFEDGTFDVLTSFGLLEHFDDVEKVIDEMVRVVKPGGLFFADIVPKRFSVQTLGHAFNSAALIADSVVRGRPQEGIEAARRQFSPDFWEADYSFETYMGHLRRAGLVDLHGTGDRPFPALALPGPVKERYVALMRRALPFWRRFDASSASWTRWWGAGWWMWGTKPGG
jgi:SAM-dependent methyltransferase